MEKKAPIKIKLKMKMITFNSSSNENWAILRKSGFVLSPYFSFFKRYSLFSFDSF
jgi:hypothetical protein